MVGYSEIDKFASRSYSAMHNIDESMNLGDITQIDESTLPDDIDLITYGFPCTDISKIGKMRGLFNTDGTLTRSGLFFDALRIIKKTQPKITIAENVKHLTSKVFKKEFEIILNSLDDVGYNVYWKILNTCDFGIPQNRERIFIIGIRKDIDNNLFEFPQSTKLLFKMCDFLDDNVEDKYYLSEKMINYILDMKDIQNNTAWKGRTDNDCLNRRIAHGLSVKSVGGNQRVGVENYILEGINDEIKVKHIKEILSNKDNYEVLKKYNPEIIKAINVFK